MRGFLLLVAGALVCSPALAQTEADLQKFFEGRTVTVTLDMPATSSGVDVYADAARPIDLDKYASRIRRTGTAIRAGESAIITKIKLKDDLVEFHLGGGGYGTFGDPTGGSAYVPPVEKSSRERQLERDVKRETDRNVKRDMENELRDLRRERSRADRFARALAEQAREQEKARIQELRLHAGSRFNVRYEDGVPPGLTPDAIVAALEEYVDFSGENGLSGAAASGDGQGFLWKGMLLDDIRRALGEPTEHSERLEGTLSVVTLVFLLDEERIEAELVEDVLIRYTVASR